MLTQQIRRQQHPHILADNFRRQIAGYALGGFVELLDTAMLVGHNNGVVRSL